MREDSMLIEVACSNNSWRALMPCSQKWWGIPKPRKPGEACQSAKGKCWLTLSWGRMVWNRQDVDWSAWAGLRVVTDNGYQREGQITWKRAVHKRWWGRKLDLITNIQESALARIGFKAGPASPLKAWTTLSTSRPSWGLRCQIGEGMMSLWRMEIDARAKRSLRSSHWLPWFWKERRPQEHFFNESEPLVKWRQPCQRLMLCWRAMTTWSTAPVKGPTAKRLQSSM